MCSRDLNRGKESSHHEFPAVSSMKFEMNSVEGEGVAPDIEVIMDPVKVLQGHDPQLEAAVEEALRLLKANPFEMKPEPAAPIRSKRPVGWDKN